MAVRDGRDVGRIAVIENKPFNQYHNEKTSNFYLFECENDMEAATALFNAAFEWAKLRGLECDDRTQGHGSAGRLWGFGIGP